MIHQRAWVDIDGMLYQILETDIHLVMTVFKDALNEIAHQTYLDEDLRLLRIPIDFYEAAVLQYAKICPFKTLMGAYGLNKFKEGDIVIHVNFEDMRVYSHIAGISQEVSVEKTQVAVI